MIQVFGTKKCRGTQKALRFFKERGLDVQFRDIAEKAPSPGELEDFARALGGYEALVDLQGAAARARGLEHLQYDPREELEREPALLLTPVVRPRKGTAAVGADEKAWKAFAQAEKG
jgi:arsenate reductase